MLGLAASDGRSLGGTTQVPGFTEITTHGDDPALSAVPVARRRLQGHMLYAVVEEGSVRAYGWVSGAGLEIQVLHTMTFTVPPHCIYIWDCLTVPGERNRGLYKALLRGMLGTLSEGGMAYVAVDLGNSPSRRALDRVGFRPLFTYYGLKLFGRSVLGLAYHGGRIVPAQRAFDSLGADIARAAAEHGGR